MLAALHWLAVSCAALAAAIAAHALIHTLCRQEAADVADLRRRVADLEAILDSDLDPLLNPEDTTP